MVVYRKPRSLPPDFWFAPAVVNALANCDIPVLLEEIRRAHGWTQSDLAAAVGYSQSWVSKVIRRAQPLTIDQVREIARRLGIPAGLLRIGDPGGDDPTNRREFGKALGMALLPLPRGARVDETTAATLTAITGGQRRLDATTPARELARGVVAHVKMADRLYARCGGGRAAAKVAAAISEAAGFAAWLHMDMQDFGSARAYYRLAVERARQAGDDLLAAYMIGSLAAFEVDADDPFLGLGYIAEARKQLGPASHPTSRAWLASIEALAHATAHRNELDAQRAEQALQAAERAIAEAPAADPPPWPWVFPFDRAKLAGYRALVAVRLDRPEQALAAFGESLASAQPAPKQRAAVMLEVATALRQAGQREHDTERIEEAFRLAGQALQIGVSHSSERVIQRARRFYRAYRGPRTPAVGEFGHRLHTALQIRASLG
ncbi:MULTISPECIES: helix-turn-helix domain-containing protein [Thermomonospora]|uniref:Transcriptional regulator, XRE family n=1 Tax=Thermomonospora curvata (strain ATCC 19995 / DSM 43183 / JCM 3096 / KCTC 9072 / NBRC 15933 / NCIMB 10081 / Henssen B9) TaxID=471852 RepID=D1A8A8_THECD|nr:MULTISPECIES: helix-turn-helix transcriptional regulator [Thermomonospora]ACZ00423.1 transcriptional regulator, XRE family [Thermomonospora curvata DSM 43183]PKK11806.1 MAG: XRE family transcriptional regulator [Thermomonospora sp. CIF 1]